VEATNLYRYCNTLFYTTSYLSAFDPVQIETNYQATMFRFSPEHKTNHPAEPAEDFSSPA
jgi:hypothetical protein